jgi:hypothetical protein
MELTDMKDLLLTLVEINERTINKNIASKIDTLLEHQPKKNRSEQINEVMSALAKAQGEMLTAGLDAKNPYYKSNYADLASVVRASRPSLTRNGLAVSQSTIPMDDGGTILETILAHCSGQWLSSSIRLVPPKNDPQTFASYMSYHKRYQYAALIGVVAANEDDDGETAMDKPRKELGKPALESYKPKEMEYETINKEQLKELHWHLENMPDLAEDILERMHIQTLADMPKEKYHVSIKRILEIKRERETIVK